MEAVPLEGRTRNVFYINLSSTSRKKNYFLLIKLHYQKLNPATNLQLVLPTRCATIKNSTEIVRVANQ